MNFEQEQINEDILRDALLYSDEDKICLVAFNRMINDFGRFKNNIVIKGYDCNADYWLKKRGSEWIVVTIDDSNSPMIESYENCYEACKDLIKKYSQVNCEVENLNIFNSICQELKELDIAKLDDILLNDVYKINSKCRVLN